MRIGSCVLPSFYRYLYYRAIVSFSSRINLKSLNDFQVLTDKEFKEINHLIIFVLLQCCMFMINNIVLFIRRAVSLTTEDLRFIDNVIKVVSEECKDKFLEGI